MNIAGFRKVYHWTLVLLWPFYLNLRTVAQTGFTPAGTFNNLDFESSILPYAPPFTVAPPVLASDAIPGWAAVGQIGYNDLSLGGAALILYGPGWTDSDYILDGSYSLSLQGYGIWQTGEVPAAAKSLIFYAFRFAGPPPLKITFGGEELPFVQLQDRGRYIAYGADVSGFAGETGELRFDSLDLGTTILDDIRFSTVAIPEPSVSALLITGALILLRKGVWPRRALERNQELRINWCTRFPNRKPRRSSGP